MIQAVHIQTAKGQQTKNTFLDYIAEDNIFAIVSIEYPTETHNGPQFMQKLRDLFINASVASLSDLELRLGGLIKDCNLPTHFSLVLGYKKNDGIYLKTYGDGFVFISRGKNCVKIVNNNQSASGKLHDKDILIFTNNDFNELNKFVNKSVIQTAEIINVLFQNQEYSGKIALVCDFSRDVDYSANTVFDGDMSDPSTEKEIGQHENPFGRMLHIIQQYYQKSKLTAGNSSKGKKITFVIVCLLLVIFIWSVVLGYQRRGEANIQKKINAAKELINQKLDQVNDLAYLNIPRAMTLINESRLEVEKLRKDIGEKKELKEIENLINQKENSIIKKEDKQYEEFFDLSVDNKQAKGNIIAYDDGLAAILDQAQGAVYVLSLTKKSLIKNSSPEIKGANNLSIYNGNVFIISKSGDIFKITENNKVNKIIENDNEWGRINAMAIYNGNIYLLDSIKDEVYKYLVAENGYSGKTSYFKSGQAVKLSEARSMAIDSSIFIGLKSDVLKYTAGVQDSFKTTYPNSNVNLTKVFTTKDLEKVYVWDKSKGSVYILSKDGTYEREASISISRQADDFIVYNNFAYFLKGEKIYSVDLR